MSPLTMSCNTFLFSCASRRTAHNQPCSHLRILLPPSPVPRFLRWLDGAQQRGEGFERKLLPGETHRSQRRIGELGQVNIVKSYN